MAAALHALAVHHGVGEVQVAVGLYYKGEAATLELPRDAEWKRLHAFLQNVVECAVPGIDVRLDTHQGELGVAVVPVSSEAADEYADELERVAKP